MKIEMKIACNTQYDHPSLDKKDCHNWCPESPKFNILQTQKLILLMQVDSLDRTTYFRFFYSLESFEIPYGY